MTMPRILLDVDGLLTSGFVDSVCTNLAAWGINVKPEDVDQWDIWKSLSIPPEIRDANKKLMQLKGVASTFKPLPGAYEFVSWCRQWAEVYFVTSPMAGPYWSYEREEWLISHFGAERSEIISCHDKWVVAGCVLIDDKLDTLKKWSAAFEDGLPILWRLPSNMHDKWHCEAKSYDELRGMLEVAFNESTK